MTSKEQSRQKSARLFLNPTNVSQNCSRAEEGRDKLTTAGGSTGKPALTRAHSIGAIGCGGKLSEGSKRQQKEVDEVFAALTLDGTEASVLGISGGLKAKHTDISWVVAFGRISFRLHEILATLEYGPKPSPRVIYRSHPKPSGLLSAGHSAANHSVHCMDSLRQHGRGGLLLCASGFGDP